MGRRANTPKVSWKCRICEEWQFVLRGAEIPKERICRKCKAQKDNPAWKALFGGSGK